MNASAEKPLALEILLSENERAREVYAEVRDLEQTNQLERLKRELGISHEHDDLVHFCGSSFLPGGDLHQETGFELICFEPLCELELDEEVEAPPKCFDVLIVNEAEKSIVAVECKISHTHELHGFEGFVRDTWRKADDLVHWMEYLSSRLGFEIEHHEIVLCARGGQEQRAAESLQRLESQYGAGTRPPHIVKLWYCGLHHRGRLQLNSTMARIDRSWNRHRNAELNRKLAVDGHVLGTSEIGTRLFFKSPTVWLASEFVGHLVESWAEAEEIVDQGGVAYGTFSLTSIEEFLKANLNHYDAPKLAVTLAERVLSAMIDCDLVETVTNGTYVFQAKMKRPKTAIKAVRDAMLERRAEYAAEQKAAQEVLRRFGEDRLPLFEDLA